MAAGNPVRGASSPPQSLQKSASPGSTSVAAHECRKGVGFRVWDLGIRDEGLEFRVRDLGFPALALEHRIRT